MLLLLAMLQLMLLLSFLLLLLLLLLLMIMLLLLLVLLMQIFMQFLFAFAAVGGYAVAAVGIVATAFVVDFLCGNAAVVVSTVAVAFDILVIKNVHYAPYVLNELILINSGMISEVFRIYLKP